MRLKHIEVFNAIMLSGSISAAARILHVTQPAVTQTLKHAEQQLGYALFIREKGGLKPTGEARQIYLRSKKIFEQVDELRRLAHSFREDGRSQFRVGIVPSLSTKCMSQALAIFMKKKPRCTVSIKIMHSEDIVKSVALRECDLGIAYGALDPASLDCDVIGTGSLMWVQRKSPGEASLPASRMQIDEIASQDFINIDDPIGKVLLGHLSESAEFKETRISAQTYQAALLLTLDGFGPCVIDSFTANFSPNDSLWLREISPRIPVPVSAISSAEGQQKKGFDDFLEAFKTVLALSQSSVVHPAEAGPGV